jgi:hypothetical protein
MYYVGCMTKFYIMNLMYSDMFYIQWHHLAKRIYGINKYMNE